VQQEQDIFEELGALCVSPGYVHAIAFLCFRDNHVRFGDKLTAEHMAPLRSNSRLTKTEISTLIGLLARQPVDYTLPTPEVIDGYIERSERLLDELHESMVAEWLKDLDPAKAVANNSNPFGLGAALREPIFYSGESAYGFQYLDLAHRKYAEDDDWLNANKGFRIQTARDVAEAVGSLQEEKLSQTLKSLESLPPKQWTMLPGFTLTASDVAERSGIDIDLVERVLAAFSLRVSDENAGFNALHDFNPTNSTPLLRRDDHEFILLQYYSLVEALYETPFYWMGADHAYAPTALAHRGRFTESFGCDRLGRVFSSAYVHRNVNIARKKGEKFGEIDVLVLFGDRAIVLQAKSKRLTLGARKGNDLQIKDDFKKAVQDAYDQARDCAFALTGPDCKLMDRYGNAVGITTPLKEIYPVCIVADHYPALSFQARQLLTYQTTDTIAPPVITDVFALDTITEMLESPLHFLSYLRLRARFGEKLMASHEHTLLAYHLKRNLWVEDKYDVVTLGDDIAVDLDVAMTVRRRGFPGARTVGGILTRLTDTAVGRMITEIEARPDPSTIDFGMLLLQLSEDAFQNLNRMIEKIAAQAKENGTSHDATIWIKALSAGLTIHCNYCPDAMAARRLKNHCAMRKYSQKADSWIGVAIRPDDRSIRFGLKLQYPWEPNTRMDARVRDLPAGSSTADLNARGSRKSKVGRNDLCPCGSGLKYKKCCLRRSQT
jgi:hypothetical protein